MERKLKQKKENAATNLEDIEYRNEENDNEKDIDKVTISDI